MIRRILRSIILSSTLGATAASPQPPLPTNHPLLLASLERTGCFGTCPVYSVTVTVDGVVRYEGLRHVSILGTRTTKLPEEDLRRLKQAFQDAGYQGMHDTYTHRMVTDHPTVITTFNFGNEVKRIRHYLGDRSAPEALTALESEIDRILRTEQWTGKGPERSALHR